MDEDNPKDQPQDNPDDDMNENEEQNNDASEAQQEQDDDNQEDDPADEDQDEAALGENDEEEDAADPMNASPDIKDESPTKLEQPELEEDEQDEPQRDQESADNMGSPEGQAVYERHQMENEEYEGEQDDQYQYDDEEGRAEMYDYPDDEETKRLDVDENEVDDIRQQLDDEGYPEEEEEEEEDPVQAKIRAIIELCEISKQKDDKQPLYGDPDFPPTDASLYKNIADPPDYAEATPVVEWLRPDDALKKPESDNICMIKDGMKPGDIKQGALGDCWLLGAFMVLATHPELLHNLIVKDGIKYGFAVFQFFKNGEWKHVFVDTRLPFNRDSKNPLYGHCADPTELWVPLMEKAYAKLHGCYEALVGGSMAEALVDLTGGISEKIRLNDPATIMMRDSGQLWKMMHKYYQSGYLLGCAKSVPEDDYRQEEGILQNHAYGILDMRFALNLYMIRIRNPWGFGEWTGKFADEDEAWDDHKGLKEELEYQFEEDGTWWMRYEDWYENYNKIYVGKIFPATWEQFSIHGKWEGNSAGGAYPSMIDRDEVKESSTQLDTNDKWFNNPQYRLSVTKKTQVYISLMQEDERMSKKPYIPVNFLVVRVKSKKQRLWEVDKDDVVIEAAEGMQRFGQREICVNCWLYPTYNKKPVHYIIVPNTETENKKEEERQFFLRIFASEKIELVDLPKTIEQSFQGKWTTGQSNTAGGRRTNNNGSENKLWCVNPQYFLNLKKPTHLKIILRKKGKKPKGENLGICVTKALPPTAAPASKIK